jgi:16S rRNA C1402 N4-methylase RsmH
MVTYTETYTDYDGNKRTEEFRFHFNQAELLEMEMSTEGSFSARVNRIVNANSHNELLQIMKKFVVDAFGVKSDDGRRFMKNDEIRRGFVECPAYSQIFMRLATDAKAAADFINNVVPDDMPKPMAT